MSRFLHKAWQNKRPGFTRRVRWYSPGNDSEGIRLQFEDADWGIANRYYDDAATAQVAYDRFANGMTIPQLDELDTADSSMATTEHSKEA